MVGHPDGRFASVYSRVTFIVLYIILAGCEISIACCQYFLDIKVNYVNNLCPNFVNYDVFSLTLFISQSLWSFFFPDVYILQYYCLVK